MVSKFCIWFNAFAAALNWVFYASSHQTLNLICAVVSTVVTLLLLFVGDY